MAEKVNIRFLGAAGTVTGSKFLLETPWMNILIDCGLFQGLKELRELNWKPFPFPPEKIDLVLLTHGHLDHTGYLPKLVKGGFSREILGTSPTLAIAEIILTDSAKIQQEDAKRANEEHFSIHEPALPLYTEEDVEETVKLFKSVRTDEWMEVSEKIKFRFLRNGHILGATFIELDINGKIFVFSGDIGRNSDTLLEAPHKPGHADFLFLESTYGDRIHPEEDVDEILDSCITKTIENNGTLIIPSFAVERLQTLMYRIYLLYQKNQNLTIPVYIDSPMGNEVLKVFSSFMSWHKLNTEEFKKMKRFFRIITQYKDTWKVIDDPQPKVVIAGSGMVTGGRVLTYLRFHLKDPNTTILLVGFQAEGTRGRQLQEGVADVKIFGNYYEVKAAVKNINSLSAHADQHELLDWLVDLDNNPDRIFLIHGEKKASDVLRVKIKDRYGWHAEIPHLGDTVTVEV
ncbi:MBL fold metallo-hydrolase RNA specificity domain-containing protein [Salinimicrobium sediminilitoris]|uniref:MBL fold metallo-hydrolase RNA specificity domain-containing protein n=1 Tax=Salinimicrobium sediminilitoris TaxID=2876715 RepID=UPI001E465A7E|nr:MBL fold metallo-hydrolase [Salinimicrobium sediminilitoris]MCC8359013.1 MBL fold metallo-hydrolase [Salinimicrobium sediminilitoris]